MKWTKSDRALLKVEIKKLIYIEKEDVEVATMLSQKGTTDHWGEVSVRDLMEGAMAIGLYKKLKGKKAIDSDADMLIDMLKNPRLGETIDMGRPINKAMLQNLETKGDISLPQLAFLKNIGKRTLTLSEELLGPDKIVHHLDVAKARGRD